MEEFNATRINNQEKELVNFDPSSSEEFDFDPSGYASRGTVGVYMDAGGQTMTNNLIDLLTKKFPDVWKTGDGNKKLKFKDDTQKNEFNKYFEILKRPNGDKEKDELVKEIF